jgi:hypothetical protein
MTAAGRPFCSGHASMTWSAQGDTMRRFIDSLSLPVILAIALALRLALPLAAWLASGTTAVFLTTDSASYLQPAVSLLRHGSFSSAGIPEIIRTPGYPLFLIPGILLHHCIAITLLLQAIAGTLTVWMVFGAAAMVGDDRRAARCAALLYAVEPLSLLYCGKIMTETLFTALILSLALVMVRYLTSRSLPVLAVAAVIAAAAAYVRPIGYYLPATLALFLIAWQGKGRASFSSAVRHISVFAIIACGLLIPWQVRNQAVSGYGGFSAINDRNLYFHHVPAVLSHNQGRDYLAVTREMGVDSLPAFFERRPELRSWSQGAVYGYMRRQALSVIGSNAGYFAWLHLQGMARTLLGPGATESLRLFSADRLLPDTILTQVGGPAPLPRIVSTLSRKPAYLAANLLLGMINIAYLLMALFPVITKRIRPSPPAILLLVVVAYFLVASGGITGASRFRHPLMPVICAFAGYGISLCLARHEEAGVRTA